MVNATPLSNPMSASDLYAAVCEDFAERGLQVSALSYFDDGHLLVFSKEMRLGYYAAKVVANLRKGTWQVDATYRQFSTQSRRPLR